MQEQAGASLQAFAQEARYFATLAQGVFEIPCCQDCGRWHFYPRACCPYCHSESLAWRRPSGRGTVYSTTTVRKPAGGDYCVCLVDLDEGPRLMSTVVDTPPAEVRIGQRVEARVQVDGDAALLVFAPAGGRP
ncbi:OB-fold domain-containing protein [Aquincola sp. MAHUQ-54]|uniref:OB-fold domain-containing protein n=1 Tax=Aquincola agrisoli TaxID=3119538 RepID=A0AAW9Q7V2_9BURK